MSPLKAVSLTFDAGGSRYELVLTQAPAGGLVVAWEGGRWLGRVHLEHGGQRIRAITFAGKIGDQDLTAIVKSLDAFRAALPWWTS